MTPSEMDSPAGLSKRVLEAHDVRRAITRMAHEIIERNRLDPDSGGDARPADDRADDQTASASEPAHGSGVVLVGLQRGGVWLAEALAESIAKFAGPVPVGSIDVSLYRDDIRIRPISPGSVSDLPFDVDGATIVLVDDVLYTGRTIKAALDALTDYGRPRSVQLAVLVDRGHRELPIRPDVVGKNLPTSAIEVVTATVDGVVIS